MSDPVRPPAWLQGLRCEKVPQAEAANAKEAAYQKQAELHGSL